MSMDLFIARAMITKTSLVFRGSIDISESQVGDKGCIFLFPLRFWLSHIHPKAQIWLFLAAGIP